MRNLKRMLCLVLSVVMLVGMMVVGAGAVSIKDFGDESEIQYKNAVALMTELGVFNGTNDGKFYPKGTLTREQLAKIAYLVMQANQDFSMYEGTASALSDIGGRWSTGAIAWCNTNGILMGGNDGKFYPDDTLTVAQTQVTLLRTLGFDNKLSGLTGTGWDINAAGLALKVGLMDGITGLKPSDPITREQACQMAFNAIFTNTVIVETQLNFVTGEVVPVKYTTDAQGNYTGPQKATTVFFLTPNNITISKIGNDGKVYDADNNVVSGLTATPDMVGSTVTYYTRGDDDTLIDAATANTSTLVATIGQADYKSKVGSNKTYIPDSPTYYLNGEKVANEAAAQITAGSVIELISTDEDSKFETVRVTNNTVATVGADPVVSSDGKKVTVAGVVTDAKIETVKGYEGLKKDDVVLHVTIGGVTYIEKVTPVVAQLTSISSGTTYNMSNGGKYTVSGLTGASSGVSALAIGNANQDMNVWLVEDKYVVKAELVDGEPAPTETQYAYVLAWKENNAEWPDTGKSYQAQLLFPDGSMKIVDVAKGHKSNAPTTDLTANELGQNTMDTLIGTNPFAAYTVDSKGNYTLTFIVAGNYENVTHALGSLATDSTLAGGKPVFAPTSNNGNTKVNGTPGAIAGNNNTVFLFKSEDGKSFSKVTGIKNLPSYTAVDANALILDSFASIVVVNAGIKTAAGGSADYVYVTSTDYTEYPETDTADAYKEYAAIIEGEVTTIKTALSYSFPAVGMYDVTLTDGLVSAAEYKTMEQGVEYSGGLVVIGGTAYTCEDAVVYVIKGDKVSTIAASDIEKSAIDEVEVVTKTGAPDDVDIDTLYIVQGRIVPASAPKYDAENGKLANKIDNKEFAHSNINNFTGEGAGITYSGNTVTVKGTLTKYDPTTASADLDALWGGTAPANGYIALTFSAPKGMKAADIAQNKVEYRVAGKPTWNETDSTAPGPDNTSFTFIQALENHTAGTAKKIEYKITWAEDIETIYTVDITDLQIGG